MQVHRRRISFFKSYFYYCETQSYNFNNKNNTIYTLPRPVPPPQNSITDHLENPRVPILNYCQPLHFGKRPLQHFIFIAVPSLHALDNRQYNLGQVDTQHKPNRKGKGKDCHCWRRAPIVRWTEGCAPHCVLPAWTACRGPCGLSGLTLSESWETQGSLELLLWTLSQRLRSKKSP